jgi:hypothetical protein
MLACVFDIHRRSTSEEKKMSAVMRAFFVAAILLAAPTFALSGDSPIPSVVGVYNRLSSGDICPRTIEIAAIAGDSVPHNSVKKDGTQCDDAGYLSIRSWVNVSSALRQRAQSLNVSDHAKEPYHEDALTAELSVFARGQDSVSYACGMVPSTGESRQIYTWIDNVTSDWARNVLAKSGDSSVQDAALTMSGGDILLQIWTPSPGYDAFSPELQSKSPSITIIPSGQCWYKMSM